MFGFFQLNRRDVVVWFSRRDAVVWFSFINSGLILALIWVQWLILLGSQGVLPGQKSMPWSLLMSATIWIFVASIAPMTYRKNEYRGFIQSLLIHTTMATQCFWFLMEANWTIFLVLDLVYFEAIYWIWKNRGIECVGCRSSGCDT